VRLLICRDCRTIDELPDYDGPPDYDVLLDNLTEQHQYPNGERHFGDLATVADHEWSDPYMREQIVRQIAKRTTGMESEFYATKSTYTEDALKCYTAHRRPTLEGGGCNDYRSDRKRIGNPTKYGQMMRKVWLCDFCPYTTTVTTAKRHARGLYKEN